MWLRWSDHIHFGSRSTRHLGWGGSFMYYTVINLLLPNSLKMRHICDLRSSFGWLQSQSRRSCDWHEHVEWRDNSSLAAYQTCCRTLHRPEVLLQAHYIGSFWCVGHFPCFCLVQHRWFFCNIFLPQQPLKSCYEKRLVMPCHAMAPLSQVLRTIQMLQRPNKMNGRCYDNLILDVQWSCKCLFIPELACSNLLSLDQMGALWYFSWSTIFTPVSDYSLLHNFVKIERVWKRSRDFVPSQTMTIGEIRFGQRVVSASPYSHIWPTTSNKRCNEEICRDFSRYLIGVI